MMAVDKIPDPALYHKERQRGQGAHGKPPGKGSHRTPTGREAGKWR
jgi:hypothetical protein